MGDLGLQKGTEKQDRITFPSLQALVRDPSRSVIFQRNPQRNLRVGTLTRTLSKFTISTPTSKSTSAQQLANTIEMDLQSIDPSIFGVEGGGESLNITIQDNSSSQTRGQRRVSRPGRGRNARGQTRIRGTARGWRGGQKGGSSLAASAIYTGNHNLLSFIFLSGRLNLKALT